MTIKTPSEKGQALIIIVVAMIGLLGMTALTVDGGSAFSDRRHAQNAADTAALAAGRAKIRNETWKTAGYLIATENGYDNSNPGQIVSVLGCDEGGTVCGQYAGNPEYIQVQITSTINTYFARIIGRPQVTNYVNAIARAIPGTTSPMFPGEAIVGTAPHDCKAVVYQGSANTTIIGGGLYVNSDCNDAAFFNHSSAAQLHAPSLCAVGGITYQPGALDIPSMQSKCARKDMQKYGLPTPSCGTQVATQTGGTLTAGSYSGTFPPHGVTNLQSGIYCVDGDFRLNGGDSLYGNGVLIYMKSGDVVWNGSADIKLSAPLTGPYAGLLLYTPPTNPSSITINGDSNSTFTGSILAPSSDVAVLGSGGATGLQSQIIGYNVDLSGDSNTTINYNANQQWVAPVAPSIELIK